VQRTASSRWFVFVLLAGQFMANLDIAVINVATPAIGASLAASGAELQLAVTAYVLASATSFVAAARLGAAVGLRPVFIAGIALFTIASLGCALAPNAGALIGWRFAQGLGGALAVAQVLAGIQRTLTGAARLRAIGAFTLTLSVSAVVGQALGGALVSADLFGTGWRAIFAINVPIGLALVALAAAVLPPARERQSVRTIDLRGAALLGAAIALGIATLTFGREHGWPPWSWLGLGACALGFVAFGRHELRMAGAGRPPLLDVRLLGAPAIAWGLAARAATLLTYFAMLFVVALYLQDGLHEPALVSGFTLVGWVAAYGLAGPLFPRLPPALARHGAAGGALIMTLAFASIAAATALGMRGGPPLAALLTLGGFGWGFCSTAMVAQLTAAAARDPAGMSGLLATLVPSAAAVGVATFGGAYLTLARAAGAADAFVAIAAAFALTTLLGAAAATVSARRSVKDEAAVDVE
jgi:MFS family permease